MLVTLYPSILQMNMCNVTDYLRLQQESGEEAVLVRRVGRVFCGPAASMATMHRLMGESGVPVSFVDQQFLSHPDNSEVARALEVSSTIELSMGLCEISHLPDLIVESSSTD